MNDFALFVEIKFVLLIVFSLVVPIGIYGLMMWKKSISPITVFCLGLLLILISGVDIYLLQKLANQAVMSPTLVDNMIFKSEISVALYLLPALFAGIGINMLSHILITHLSEAEKRFKQSHARSKSED